VKLVDPRGEMLESSWEAHATVFANAPNSGAFVAAVDELVKTAKIDLSKPARVVYARDTRPTGPELITALKDGLEAMKAEYRDAGISTTPVLHYLVRTTNTKGTKDSYGDDTEEGYLTKLSDAFKKLLVGHAYIRIYVANFRCRLENQHHHHCSLTVPTVSVL
jgi:phosphoacetylglucosamine mutase